MSLKAFHIFFVTVSILLSLLLISWGYRAYTQSPENSDIALIAAGVISLLFLVPYGRWFLKKYKSLALAAFGISFLLSPQAAEACAVCFGDPNSSMVQGIKAGIWVLIAVITGVLIAIASIAYSWHQRAKQLDC